MVTSMHGQHCRQVGRPWIAERGEGQRRAREVSGEGQKSIREVSSEGPEEMQGMERVCCASVKCLP